jgi:chemotaxis response regulator CheB
MPFQTGARLCAGRCYIGTSERAIDIGLDETVWAFQNADPIPHADGATNFDRLLGAVAELYLDRVVIVLLSGCEVGTMQGLEKVKENGGQIVAPQLEKCILPVTIAPVVEKGLVTEIFSPKEIGQMLARYCS